MEQLYFKNEKKYKEYFEKNPALENFFEVDAAKLGYKKGRVIFLYSFDDAVKDARELVDNLVDNFLNGDSRKVDIEVIKEKAIKIFPSTALEITNAEDLELYFSIQRILFIALKNKYHKVFSIKIDQKEFLSRLREQFLQFLLLVKNKVIDQQTDYVLDPMNSEVRDEVHKILLPFPEITTRSQGEGEARHIVVRYARKVQLDQVVEEMERKTTRIHKKEKEIFNP